MGNEEPAVTAAQRTRLGAYAWAESDGRLLVCRIAPPERVAGRWTLPGGGLEFGEDPAAGVVRELEEETGLTGVVRRLAAVRSVVLEPDAPARPERIHAVGFLYVVAVAGGDLRDEPDGSTDRAAWVPFADLDGLPSVPLLRWARAELGR